MKKLRWFRRQKTGVFSPNAFVRRSTLLSIFRVIAGIQLDLRGTATAREINGGVEIDLHQPAAIPGLRVKSTAAGYTVAPIIVNGFMPEIGTTPINAAAPPALRGTGTICLSFDVTTAFTQGGYRPLTSTVGPVIIGWESNLPSSQPDFLPIPYITWNGGDVEGDTAEPSVTDGTWVIPIALVSTGGRVTQILEADPGETEIQFSTLARLW